jgi:hypothetical protein
MSLLLFAFGTFLLSCGSSSETPASQGPNAPSNSSNRFEETNFHFAFSYPDNWLVKTDSVREHSFYSPSTNAALASGDVVTAPDVTLTILDNTQGAPLATFVQNYREGWFAQYGSLTSRTAGGHEVVFADDSAAQVPSQPEIAAFVRLDGGVLLFVGGRRSRSDIDAILNSLVFQ